MLTGRSEQRRSRFVGCCNSALPLRYVRSVLQCVAVCCSMLQVLQCVPTCCSVLQYVAGVSSSKCEGRHPGHTHIPTHTYTQTHTHTHIHTHTPRNIDFYNKYHQMKYKDDRGSWDAATTLCTSGMSA